MNIAIVYGTRPEFLKLKCLIDLFYQQHIAITVIKINQHINLSEDNGYYNHTIHIDTVSTNRISTIGATILTKLPEYIENVTHILAQGDTATVFYSLLCGFQMKKVCIHLEAGMRTYDLNNPYPEEGFRQMISRITDIHLCPSEVEEKILLSEKVKGSIHIVGNTILDLVKSYQIPITNDNKILITLHRRENWNDFKEYIIALSELCNKNQNYTFYFLTHPNPSFHTILAELKDRLASNMIIMNSLPHYELIQLLSSCSCVITDSGGIQEEANFLGKHMYVLRKVTERQSIPLHKITLCTLDTIYLIKCTVSCHEQGLEYGNGESCRKILTILC